MVLAVPSLRVSDAVPWRRKTNPTATRRRDAVTTGVILARLDSVIDRLEGVYAQLAQTLPIEEHRPGGTADGREDRRA